MAGDPPRELERLAADGAGFTGMTSLGVDEHIWNHVDPRRRGLKVLTGMVDLTCDSRSNVRAPLRYLVSGPSGKVDIDWLRKCGEAVCRGVEVAALHPCAGYNSAIG
ncbi:hypothetical protein [Georgenia muralis]